MSTEAQDARMSTRAMMQVYITGISFYEHDVEICGHCAYGKLLGDVASQVLEKVEVGEPDLAALFQCVTERWNESKFVKLFREESAAGQDPTIAFQARGWEM